jgi:hypothetical protein
MPCSVPYRISFRPACSTPLLRRCSLFDSQLVMAVAAPLMLASQQGHSEQAFDGDWSMPYIQCDVSYRCAEAIDKDAPCFRKKAW